MNEEKSQECPIAQAVAASIKATNVPHEFLDCAGIVLHKDLVFRPITEAERRDSHQNRTRARGTDFAHDLPSLIALVATHEIGPDSCIFGDWPSRQIVAVINHAAEGGLNSGWRDRRIVLKLTQSEKLKQWKKLLEPTGQVEFAEFLDDHAADLDSPSAADVRELALELEATQGIQVKARRDLSNGDCQLSFTQDTTTNVNLPGFLMLRIPMFEGGVDSVIRAGLRYRIREGKPIFFLTLPGLEDIMRREFQGMMSALAGGALDSRIVLGSCPEEN